MTQHTDVPQLGRTSPAILASDSLSEVEAKIDAHLAEVRVAFDKKHEVAIGSGEASNPDYAPNGGIAFAVAYTDDESADRALPVLNHAVSYAIAKLPEFRFVLLDLADWRPVDLTDENDENEFGHDVGIQYRINIAREDYSDVTNRMVGDQLRKGHQQFVNGELGGGGGGHDPSDALAAVLRRLGHQ